MTCQLLYPIALFETLFNKVFTLCINAGMVSGHTQVVDSAPIKVNASIESVIAKVPATSIESYLQKVEEENAEKPKADRNPPASGGQRITAPEHELKRVQRYQRKLQQNSVSALGAGYEKAQLLSNKTHYSPHDPDARISVKPGKARQLNYHCSKAVDSAEGVISHIQADFANKRDSQCLPSIVTGLQSRLKDNELVIASLLADTNYANGYNYALLEQKSITGWVPVFGKYKAEIEGFSYNKEKDEYSCPMNKLLPFKGFYRDLDGSVFKNYLASVKDCRVCPRKSSCVPNIPRRKITRTFIS